MSQFDNQFKPMPGQLQNGPINPPDVFDELRNAQQRFHNACQNAYAAQVERSEAEKALREISAKAHQIMECALQDPTVPQTACAPPNGRY